MKLVTSSAFLLLLILSSSNLCTASDIFLSWDANLDDTTAGYKVYYSKDSLSFPFNGSDAVQGISPIDVGYNTVGVLNGLDYDSKYYFAVTAYDSKGIESEFSNIVAVNDSEIGNIAILANYDLTSAIYQAVSMSKYQQRSSVVAYAAYYGSVLIDACGSEIYLKGGVSFNVSSYDKFTEIFGSFVVACGSIIVDGIIIR